MVTSFIIFLLMFMVVGVWAVRHHRRTTADYYLASRSIAPWLVGLSAVATNNSGYMFIGVIGYTYVTGLPAFWLMAGWIVGDFLASQFIHRRLREVSGHQGEVSLPGLLSNWQYQGFNVVRVLSALITLVLLGAYAAAQLKAGSKALHVLMDWPLEAGAVLGAVIVVIYCFAGGIRASIWTDAAQSIVMLVAMAILLFAGFQALGGWDSAVNQWRDIPHYLDWFPQDLAIPGAVGMSLFVIGWLFAGFSVVGQPHIMVRFMALDDLRNFNRARVYYYLWFTVFYGMATGVGLLSRLLFSDAGGLDPELALPTMAMDLLHPVMVGLVLAAIFAATMSTADSLVLSCSAALAKDLLPEARQSVTLAKGSTILVVAVALWIALTDQQNVFNLVIFAWSGLASAFAPLLLVYLLGMRPREPVVVAMILAGLGTAIGWRMAGWHGTVYEGLPGILAGLIVCAVAAVFTRETAVYPEQPDSASGKD